MTPLRMHELFETDAKKIELKLPYTALNYLAYNRLAHLFI